MTIRVLEIKVLDKSPNGSVLGHIKFNGPTGTQFQNAVIRYPYHEESANMKLLNEGEDYSTMGIENYISISQEILNKNSQTRILVKEKKLSEEVQKALMEFDKKEESYSTHVGSGSVK